MRSLRLLAPAVVIAVALALVGCSLAPEKFDAEPIKFGKVGEPTPVGTALELGEPAWIERLTETGRMETVGVSILKITEKKKAFWEDVVDNPEDFESFTPFVIIVQYQFPDAKGDKEYEPDKLPLFPVFADGTDANFVKPVLPFGSPTSECELKFPEYNPKTAVLVTCFLGAAEGEDPITGVMYNGNGYNQLIADPENEFLDKPITWQK